MGILVNTGFDVGSSSPIDNRTLKETTLERDALVSDGKVYENLKVYCKDTQKEYRWTGTEWETVDSSGSGGAVIDDTVTSTSKTHSSSKIHEDIQQCLDSSKAYILSELGKLNGASYKVVASTSEMTNKSIIYLLPNATNYDMYIVEEDGTAIKIGNMDIDLSQYFTKQEITDNYYDKATSDGKFATITTVDGKLDKTSISTTIDSSSTDTQVPTGKATYDITKYNTIDFMCPSDKSPLEFALENTTRNKIIYFRSWENNTSDKGVSYASYIAMKHHDPNYLTLIAISSIYRQFKINNYQAGKWTGWQEIYSTTVADVGKTTITPASSNVTGTIKYTVKNGICYVSLFNVKSKTNDFGLSISTTMPKPAINCGSVIVTLGTNGNIGFAYINENTTQLMVDFYIANVNGSCSFSYPVAE